MYPSILAALATIVALQSPSPAPPSTPDGPAHNWQYEGTIHDKPNPGLGDGYNPDYDAANSTYTLSELRPDVLAHSELYENGRTHCSMNFGYVSTFAWYGGGTPSNLWADVTIDANCSENSSSDYDGRCHGGAAAGMESNLVPQGSSTIIQDPSAQAANQLSYDDLLFFADATIPLNSMVLQQEGTEYNIPCGMAAATDVGVDNQVSGPGAATTGKAYINIVPDN